MKRLGILLCVLTLPVSAVVAWATWGNFGGLQSGTAAEIPLASNIVLSLGDYAQVTSEAGNYPDRGIWDNDGLMASTNAIAGWVSLGILEFDGTDDHFTVADSASLQFGPDMSVFVWIKLDTIADDMPIIRKRDAGGTQYQLYIDTTPTPDTLRFYDGRVPDGLGISNGTTPLTTGAWFHVGIVVDGAASKFYINAVDNGNVDGKSYLISADDAPTFVGADHGLGAFLDGQMGDIIVYDEAVSTNVINALYALGSP